MIARRLLLLAGASLFSTAAAAQTVTAIVPDGAGSAFAAGTTVARAGRTYTIDGGTLAGTNLFHSFQSFDLGAADTARWTTSLAAPASITNVINRVTGGSASHLDGRINSTALPNASFFFINPAGIVFGAGARVNVPGAAYFSTGQALRFADGTSFSAVTPGGSTFSVAAPQSFGFLGGQGDIVLNGTASLLVSPASTLGLYAGNLDIEGAGIGGSGLSLIAAGSGSGDYALGDPLVGTVLTGAVDITDSALSIATANGASLIVRGGSILLDDSSLGSTASNMLAAGPILLGADRITLRNASDISASTNAGGEAGTIAIAATDLSLDASDIRSLSGAAATGAAGNIGITATNVSLTNDAVIRASTSGAGNAGNVLVTAQSMLVDFSTIASNANPGSTGTGGTVSLVTGSLIVRDDSAIGANSSGAGSSGLITIATGDMTIDGSQILSSALVGATGNAGLITIGATGALTITDSLIASATNGPGTSGIVTLAADTISVQDSSIQTNANAGSTGSAGAVLIGANSITAGTGSIISSSTFGAGNAGGVLIGNGVLHLDGGSIVKSNAEAGATGNAGAVTVSVRQAGISGGARIITNTSGPGAAGQVSLTADAINLDNGFILSNSNAGAAGAAGNITLMLGALGEANGSRIASNTNGGGDAGSVDITATGAVTLDASFITSNADIGSSGRSGRIGLDAGSLALSGASIIGSNAFATGNARSVRIQAGTIDMAGGSSISSDSLGAATGNAGSVNVSADSATLGDSSYISSSTFGSGNAGSVNVAISGLTLRSGGYVSSDTYGCASGCIGGHAGDVTVTADRLALDTGYVSSDTYGTGNAGDVAITAADMRLANDSIISSGAFDAATGASGVITISASTLDLASGGEISTSTYGTGAAGAITIAAKALTLEDGFIDSDTYGCADRSCTGGAGGDIAITAATIALAGESTITSDTEGSGNAGSLMIQASRIGLRDTSRFASRSIAPATGNAGSISVGGDRIVISDDASISTNTFGSGLAGSIDISATNSLSLDHGTIRSNAQSTSAGVSGRIRIDVPNLELTDAGQIETVSANANSAGDILISSDSVIIRGANSHISSANIDPFAPAPGASARSDAAGAILLAARLITIADGGAVTTNSAFGPAGNISFTMPDEKGILLLQGAIAPGIITTSSGPGTGGMISISNPLAVISNGGSLLAQGQQGGANLFIDSEYFIRSADRTNLIAVDGPIALDSNIYDVSNGTAVPTVSFLDASKVLSGQCASARNSGETSGFGARAVGPYAPLAAKPLPAKPMPVKSAPGIRTAALSSGTCL